MTKHDPQRHEAHDDDDTLDEEAMTAEFGPGRASADSDDHDDDDDDDDDEPDDADDADDDDDDDDADDDDDDDDDDADDDDDDDADDDDDDDDADEDDDDDDDGIDLGPIILGEGYALPADWGPTPEDHRSGLVTLVGRPNAGKSTLLNALLGEKLSIMSPKPQTTRDLIRGYLTRPGLQIVLVDTPGIHQVRKGALLNRAMVGIAIDALDSVDVALLVVDAVRTARILGEVALPTDERGVTTTPTAEQALQLCHRGDRAIVQRLVRHEARVIVVLNKRDQIKPRALLPLMAIYGALPGVIGVVPTSARTGEGVDDLVQITARELPLAPMLVDPELLTDRSERFLCAELLREALFHALDAEVPYRVAVLIEQFDESGEQIQILASVLVERPSQKGIVLGKGGLRMREVASRARAEMIEMLGRRVYLEVHVRVEPNWTERIDALRRLGYADGLGAA